MSEEEEKETENYQMFGKIDCTADFYYIDCNSFTQPGNSHMLFPLQSGKYMYAVEHFY